MKNVTIETPEAAAFKSMSARVMDIEMLRAEANRMNVRQSDFVGVLLRAWNSLPAHRQLTFIPKPQLPA